MYEVLETPAPAVRLISFGENGLEFELRAWTTTLVHRRGKFTSKINYAIYDKFKEHEIEVPYPQRDIRIRSGAVEMNSRECAGHFVRSAKFMSVITMNKLFATLPAFVFSMALPVISPTAQQTAPATSSSQLRGIENYIGRSWHTLTRSNRDLGQAVADPKFPLSFEQRSVLYVPAKEDINKVESLLRAQIPAQDFARIPVQPLPEDVTEIKEPGLLYLPHPYVVPGGRFNEMYGWDSYFIQVGLLRAGEIELARNMVDNFVHRVACFVIAIIAPQRGLIVTNIVVPRWFTSKSSGSFPERSIADLRSATERIGC